MSATSRTTVAARLDRIRPIRMHKRMAVAIGFANFFDLYDIFLGGVLAAVLAEEWASVAEIFPTRMRSTAVSTSYSLSRLSGAILPFISVAALDNLGPTAVFLGSAAVLTVVALDVGLLGPRSTGLNLETSSDEIAGTAPPPVDAGPRFTREGPRTVTRPERDGDRAQAPAERSR